MTNTPTLGNIYYLQSGAHQEVHKEVCCCSIKTPLPHLAFSASVYLLDGEGLQLLYEAKVKERTESFVDWLQNEEADTTFYCYSERTACAATVDEAVRDGDLVINAPERYPWLGFVLDAFSDEIATPDPDDNLLHASCWCDTMPSSSKRCPICRDRAIAIMHHYL